MGWRPLLLTHEHPYQVVVTRGDEALRVKIYVWRVTGGGMVDSEARLLVETLVELLRRRVPKADE